MSNNNKGLEFNIEFPEQLNGKPSVLIEFNDETPKWMGYSMDEILWSIFQHRMGSGVQ